MKAVAEATSTEVKLCGVTAGTTTSSGDEVARFGSWSESSSRERRVTGCETRMQTIANVPKKKKIN